jgi:hypothetical protein
MVKLPTAGWMTGLKAEGLSYLPPLAEWLRNHPPPIHSVLGTLSSEHGADLSPPSNVRS